LVRSVVAEDALSRYFLLAVTPSGEIITSFGNGGWREVNPSGLGLLAPEADLEIDARGHINVVVSRWDPEGSFDLDVYFLRYSVSGTLVTTIGDGGLVAIADPGGAGDDEGATARSLSFDANGRIVVGYQGDVGALRIVDLDASDSGWMVPGSMLAPEVVSQGNGRLLTVGDPPSQDGFRASRWLVPDTLDLEADDTFDDDGTIVLDVDLGAGNGEQIVDAVLWQGRPLYLGFADCQSLIPTELTCGFLVRAENDYIFADGFNSGGRGNWSSSAP